MLVLVCLIVYNSAYMCLHRKGTAPCVLHDVLITRGLSWEYRYDINSIITAINATIRNPLYITCMYYLVIMEIPPTEYNP